jgi:hypothetical protein
MKTKLNSQTATGFTEGSEGNGARTGVGRLRLFWFDSFPAAVLALALAISLSLAATLSAGTFSDADWVSLNPSTQGANDVVQTIAVDGDGNVYVGGNFTFIGTVAANGIAKWNGSTWSTLGSGMAYESPYVGDEGFVRALAVNGSILYAGGRFTSAGGVAATNIAKWNGSTWSAVGSGMDGNVFALAVNGTNLYAGGGFWTVGGVPVVGIAKWDGSTWAALGVGMLGGNGIVVNALAVSGNALYAGGSFDHAGGVLANGIAKWDGNSWSAFGSGANDEVLALAVSGTDLYVCGGFNTMSGVAANGIAKWDGSSWSALGSGVAGCLYPNWSSVKAIAVSGTNLYIGGDFTMVGGAAATNIAKWNGNAWSALGSGTDNNVYALAADDAGHLFVGGNFLVAGTNVSPLIAQANIAPQTIRIERIRVVGGLVMLDCSGRSGNSCSVQRASDVFFTQNVTTLLQTNAPSNGAFCHTDPNPPNGTVFYRLTMP